MDSQNPWEQLPYESDRMYRDFKHFLEMVPPRSVTLLAKQQGVPGPRLRSVARKYRWKDRARAYDLCAVVPDNMNAEQKRMVGVLRQGLFARFQNLVAEGLLDLDTPRTIRLLLEVIAAERNYFYQNAEQMPEKLVNMTIEEILKMEAEEKRAN